jgi:SAM-dependent methyltransferase
MRKLDDSQAQAFDTEYVEGSRWEAVKDRIDKDFAAGDFNFLDVGGGNGRFSDRLLERYPRATATVLDNSEMLLSRNKSHERKTLVCHSVDQIGEFKKGHFDLISVHWLLHHLVSESYTETRQNQIGTLRALRELLSPRGRISVFENIYHGWLIEGLPGRIIYRVTSARSVSGIARWLGANAAGVGVCFLSRTEWMASFHTAGLEVLNYTEPDQWIWPLRLEWRLFLHLRHIRTGHFWVRSANAGTGSSS